MTGRIIKKEFTAGRYTVSMPFKAIVTAYAWGGGGGGGGMDSQSIGGIGAPGLYNTTTFTVQMGSSLEVIVGSGGTGGASNAGSAPGGKGGPSRIDINGDITQSFNGGDGSAAGPRPWSGGGGGGGGASVILVNDSPILVAGGGAGGGGAGNDHNGPTQYARRDAAITNNAIGLPGIDFRGGNAQYKGGDGGGAGGGGGGFPGGNGGAVYGGDASGFAGQCGGNFPIVPATTGQDSPFYVVGFSAGGDRGGGNGQNGRVVLEITPQSLLSVKVSDNWKQVSNGFVKVGGVWRPIAEIFVKVNDSWRPVNNSGIGDFNLTQTSLLYGKEIRSFS